MQTETRRVVLVVVVLLVVLVLGRWWYRYKLNVECVTVCNSSVAFAPCWDRCAR